MGVALCFFGGYIHHHWNSQGNGTCCSYSRDGSACCRTSRVAVPASAPCTVLTPSNALRDCHVTVEGTCAELYTCPVNENVTELFLLPDASVMAESYHSELCVCSSWCYCCRTSRCGGIRCRTFRRAGVHIYELFVCPDEVMETISESPIIPFSALETNHELSALSVAITNSVIMARKAACDLSICLATAKEVISDLSICPVTAKEANLVISTWLVTTTEAICKHYDCPDEAKGAAHELTVCPASRTDPGSSEHPALTLGSWIICLCSVFQCLQGLSLCMALYSVCSAVVAFWSIGSDLMVLCSAMASCSACSGFLLCYGSCPGYSAMASCPACSAMASYTTGLCYGFLPCQIRHGPCSTIPQSVSVPWPRSSNELRPVIAPWPRSSTVPKSAIAPLPRSPTDPWSTNYSMVQVLNCASVCHCSMVQASPSLPLFCLRSTSLLDLCLFCLSLWKPLLKGGWLCPAGVPTSSSRGHSIQNLYHCLTKSISQYTPCLISYTAGFNQEDYLRHTHTHYIAKSCFNASGHYWAFNSVFIALFMTLDCFSVLWLLTAWPDHRSFWITLLLCPWYYCLLVLDRACLNYVLF